MFKMVQGFTLSKRFPNLYEPQREKKHKLKAKASALQLTRQLICKASWPTYITYVNPNIKEKLKPSSSFTKFIY